MNNGAFTNGGDGSRVERAPGVPGGEAGTPLTRRQRDAEEIRAHLVSLRGGAPFLSSNDGMLLEDWLDRGVSVGAILSALERCADSRRKKASRLPLTLSAAKRHLGKPGTAVRRVIEERPQRGHRLLPLIARVQELGGPGANALADGLLAVPTQDAEHALRASLACVRTFVEVRWNALDTPEREARVATYLQLLELDPDEPASAGYATALGLARDSLRRDWPWLNAATISELLS
ncbi:MAG: hypothetical protein EP330_19825 [Deltaproteobacteria bacterium]|nr:MAG: hypothetical protein EP330_19825 [Deltaproteobacteria bacterium]